MPSPAEQAWVREREAVRLLRELPPGDVIALMVAAAGALQRCRLLGGDDAQRVTALVTRLLLDPGDERELSARQ